MAIIRCYGGKSIIVINRKGCELEVRAQKDLRDPDPAGLLEEQEVDCVEGEDGVRGEEGAGEALGMGIRVGGS